MAIARSVPCYGLLSLHEPFLRLSSTGMHYVHTIRTQAHANEFMAKFLPGGCKFPLASSMSPQCFAKDDVDVCNVTCAFPGLLFPALCTY